MFKGTVPGHVFNILSPSIKFSDLEIHLKEQTVYRNGELVPMPHHEFFTLLYLTQHPSWVLSKEQIYEAVWRENPEHCGATVANVAYSFRRKIGEGYIETVVGSGYRFVG
ncbi:winged helix-turn-helix domain-containing protein [Blautia sp. MSJ-9]|nr:winged helix-turn-helix domain-containing protein [Blautia sp. MSJ-9]